MSNLFEPMKVEGVRIMGNGMRLLFDQPVAAKPVEKPKTPPENRKIIFAPDFSTVRWGPQAFHFVGKQRAIVAALKLARDEGYDCLSQAYLLEVAGSECSRVRDLFRGHPAWGSMIVHAAAIGGSLGGYTIADPPIE